MGKWLPGREADPPPPDGVTYHQFLMGEGTVRINVYAEELTDRVEIVTKRVGDREYRGLRFYLYLPVTTTRGVLGMGPEDSPVQLAGPFVHGPDDDDSAAITFWSLPRMAALLEIAAAILADNRKPGTGTPSNAG